MCLECILGGAMGRSASDGYSQSELLIGDGCGKARLALMLQHEEYNVFGYTKEAWERQRTMTGN